jgi:hypothetical protein
VEVIFRFCIDSTQKRALALCRGSMDEGDGYGSGYGTPDGGGYGSGYGLDGDRGAPDGGSPAEWR